MTNFDSPHFKAIFYPTIITTMMMNNDDIWILIRKRITARLVVLKKFF